MIFCGDLSIPNTEKGKELLIAMDRSGIFKNEIVIMNLEGVIHPRNPKDTFWKVYNDSSAINLKDTCKLLIFNIANNHTYDYPEYIKEMKETLIKNHIQFFGLKNQDGSFEPLEFVDGDIKYAFFGHCWDVYTKTNTNTKTDDRVVDCTYKEFYNTIIKYMRNNSDRKVFCFFHWNFDMEKYPFPAYKKLARDLVDSGVEAVIGNHAHVQQEVEIYKDKIIAYGLGNFYMPDGFYFNGTLKYPKESHRMYVIRSEKDKHEVLEFYTDVKDCAIKFKENKTVNEYCCNQYSKRNDDQYKKIFVKNRVKKKLVPVFYTYEDNIINKIKKFVCIERIKFIRFVKMTKDRRRIKE